MPNGVVDLLNSLDALIAEHQLHAGDPRGPVCADNLLESAVQHFHSLPQPVHAISVHLSGDAGITFNDELRELPRRADLNRAKGHEFGHILQEDIGLFLQYSIDARSRSWELDRHTFRGRERKCDMIAAYLYVPRRALTAMKGEDPGYIARVLDVPEYLVVLRMEIYRKYKR